MYLALILIMKEEGSIGMLMAIILKFIITKMDASIYLIS